MQLKIRRSQRDSGVLSKTVVFCIDAQVGLSPTEQQSVTRYKLHQQVIYNSEASKRALDRGDAVRDGSMKGSLGSLAWSALAAMNLNITIRSLQDGQRIECKSLDELLAAEDAIMTACRNLQGYLDTAATFDGREQLFDFDTGEPQVVAQSVTPQPMLVAPTEAPAPLSTPAPSDDGPSPAAAEPGPFAAPQFATTAFSSSAAGPSDADMLKRAVKIFFWAFVALVALATLQTLFSP